ncbi:hypothetical protein AMS68_006797 [Peltaster fructicola]|uniref:Uncharacterized protein n=1 Tax=Peltaster fructicola TaxID=286661 RepID=A0A6H0Y3S7_9PEZI|nr:hypothetical protein AMS68_006797 [Peltaster fructicola]
MLASRRDQENAVHAQQKAVFAKSSGAKPLAPKTPSQQTSKTPFRGKRHDENAISVKNGDGKVKDAVAALEKKTTFKARTRAPLGAKTANAKGNAIQTPARALTQQKVLIKATSPRLRRAKFQVHEAKDDVPEPKSEEREIEIMHPREIPLPDVPDDDVWPHDRTYPQFEGANFTKGWALEFFDEEEDDFNTRMKQFEAEQDKSKITFSSAAPATLTSARAASALGAERGTASFASATSASAARSKVPLAVKKTSTKASLLSQRHTVAKAVSNTTIGYSKGRRVSNGQQSIDIPKQPATTGQHAHVIGKQGVKDEYSPLTPVERNSVLNAMWRASSSDDEVDDFNAPMLEDIDLGDLRDFGAEVPDD